MNKCNKCNKNRHIMLECDCGKLYCMKHFKREKHNCTYNSKEENKIKIISNNPIIKQSKIEKI